MKLVTYSAPTDANARLGALVDYDRVVNLAGAWEKLRGAINADFDSMQSLIEAGPMGLDAANDIISRADGQFGLAPGEYKLLAPIPRPIQLRDCFCFEGHLTGSLRASMKLANITEPNAFQLGTRKVFSKRPIYYKANRFAVTGPDTDIHWPSYSRMMDYELEMACVIGRTGRNIKTDEARSFIFGFTIFNDFSARDTQAFEMMSGLGPSKSKDFDNANAMGPCIVTADEFDPSTAAMTARINGETQSSGSGSTMTYSFEDLISFISVDETLHAGEMLGSGTVGGGCGFEQDRLLNDGDVVELEIAGIGTLRNRVFASAPASQRKP